MDEILRIDPSALIQTYGRQYGLDNTIHGEVYGLERVIIEKKYKEKYGKYDDLRWESFIEQLFNENPIMRMAEENKRKNREKQNERDKEKLMIRREKEKQKIEENEMKQKKWEIIIKPLIVEFVLRVFGANAFNMSSISERERRENILFREYYHCFTRCEYNGMMGVERVSSNSGNTVFVLFDDNNKCLVLGIGDFRGPEYRFHAYIDENELLCLSYLGDYVTCSCCLKKMIEYTKHVMESFTTWNKFLFLKGVPDFQVHYTLLTEQDIYKQTHNYALLSQRRQHRLDRVISDIVCPKKCEKFSRNIFEMAKPCVCVCQVLSLIKWNIRKFCGKKIHIFDVLVCGSDNVYHVYSDIIDGNVKVYYESEKIPFVDDFKVVCFRTTVNDDGYLCIDGTKTQTRLKFHILN